MRVINNEGRTKNASDTWQRHISSASAKLWLDRDQRGGAVEIFAKGIQRLGSIDAPPLRGRANLLCSKRLTTMMTVR
jgi:hypothetical protein